MSLKTEEISNGRSLWEDSPEDFQEGIAATVRGAADALDLASFLVRQDADGGFGTEQQSTYKVDKPPSQAFFRVHPSPEYEVTVHLLDLKCGMASERYLVHPRLIEAICATPGLNKDVVKQSLVLAQTRERVNYLWPMKFPRGDGNPGDRWNESARAAANVARRAWIRLVSNRDTGAYEPVVATGVSEEPRWPDEPILEILKRAFGEDRIIGTLDHKVLKRLRGEL